MKRITILFVMLAAVTLSGCDMFRKLAGRPVSSELDAVRERVEAEMIAKRDSALMAEKAIAEMEARRADSLAVLDTIRMKGIQMHAPQFLNGLDGEVSFKYCVMLGVFRNPENIERLYKLASDAGYAPVKVPFQNSLTSVSVGAGNSLRATFDTFRKVSKEKFCPKDAWILVMD